MVFPFLNYGLLLQIIYYFLKFGTKIRVLSDFFAFIDTKNVVFAVFLGILSKISAHTEFNKPKN